MTTIIKVTIKGLIFHSDQRVQYASKKLDNTIESYRVVIRTISRRGNSGDNAKAESFF